MPPAPAPAPAPAPCPPPAPSLEQPPLVGSQLCSQVAAPLHWSWQVLLHWVVRQLVAPLHVCWHPLPAHDSVLDLAEDVRLQPPPAQSSVTLAAFVAVT